MYIVAKIVPLDHTEVGYFLRSNSKLQTVIGNAQSKQGDEMGESRSKMTEMRSRLNDE